MTSRQVIELNDGNTIPQLGLGVWKATDGEEVEAAVLAAIQAGYRLIDTAAVYQNERGVGSAIRASGIDRKELFITTKLWNNEQGAGKVRPALLASLERLGLDYIDLYLIHWPMPAVGKYLETWREFELLQKEGLVRSIGVSNFHVKHLEELKKHSRVLPAVNQIELHPYFQQTELREYCKSQGIRVESWSPLGGSGSNLLGDPLIEKIAKKYAKTVAQVVLRWHLQNDLVVIPKSSNPQHIKENFAVFDFILSPSDMRAIATLDTGERSGPDPDTMNIRVNAKVVDAAVKVREWFR